ncbi:indole-diterpene biosynthesis protein-like protein PaxU [Lindgomyces ingoldianus]|uniref:Indole-diterpene biosynthesis protein-like protein PaxU n=1 Tax=Lindgomyces ingoldianus TaxID=673940 RepID=A0ACB6RES7_9PLEO|nr:indole-diterpene biosynthesis protein-like protein PaxU [Lindgomyces ingoldianus]KAF2477641.1 indole-diterpene biosynthesis protein-like protein PaxU [Lindgomyces ingoldianus]
MAHKPLSEFQKIGYNTFIWTPPSYSAQSPLIFFFAWNAAAAKHIAKYTLAYQKLFPSARILLVRCNTPDMFRKAESYRKLQTPAFEVVQEHVRSGGEVLVHSFSNGGGNQVVHFAKLWRDEEGGFLPMRAQILDSSPGKGPWMRSHAAIVLSLPRTFLWRVFGGLAVHLLLLMIFLFNMVTRKEPKFIIMGRELNDPTIFSTKAPRVYLYSKADQMVGHDEVEEHADDATSKGYDVRKVRFESSPHAGHVREDEGKYWGAVMDAWNRGRR